MKREIKFRAWNESRGMLNNCGFHPHLTSDLAAEDDHYHKNQDGRYIINPSMGGFELMQYTGLKDKNGVESFDDDIVSHDTYGIGIVKYEESTAGYYIDFGGVEWAMTILTMLDCKIIGNIHQDPELLK